MLFPPVGSGVNPVDTYIRSGVYGKLPTLPYTPGKGIHHSATNPSVCISTSVCVCECVCVCVFVFIHRKCINQIFVANASETFLGLISTTMFVCVCLQMVLE